jgi:citrate synthase
MNDFVPGLAGVPAARSAVSFIDGEAGILEFRGIRVETLAEKSSYEEVAYLLLFGRLPKEAELKAFSEELNTHRAVSRAAGELIRRYPAKGHPMDAMQAAVAALAMDHPSVDYSQETERTRQAIHIIAKMPTIVAAFQRARNGLEMVPPDMSLGHAADFLHMLTGAIPDALSARIMDACLVVHADHTMAASTFAARVTASTGASPYAVLGTAIGALSGPLHGGANERVLIQLRAIGSPSRVRNFVAETLKKQQKIMGLGHRVYKTKDPRAYIIQDLAHKLFEKKGKSDIYDIAVELEAVAKETLAVKGIYPNVDFYAGIVYDRLGIPADIFTPIFAISRTAGWMAHWLEQMRDNRLFRPKQVYDGPRAQAYVPIADR